jgi:hypothetical protein
VVRIQPFFPFSLVGSLEPFQSYRLASASRRITAPEFLPGLGVNKASNPAFLPTQQIRKTIPFAHLSTNKKQLCSKDDYVLCFRPFLG